MSNALDLLRMLEPAVRPGGLPGPSRAASSPIESRSFESLLEEAKSAASQGSNEMNNESKLASDPLKALAQINVIDNAALLDLISARASLAPSHIQHPGSDA